MTLTFQVAVMQKELEDLQPMLKISAKETEEKRLVIEAESKVVAETTGT